mmetsp:Transcript_4095/g.6822  ORF Transcript_4095/g.6822 Transcript_4095/m.6822 type:complete len:96 (-) Transcript_4095:104-391(-)
MWHTEACKENEPRHPHLKVAAAALVEPAAPNMKTARLLEEVTWRKLRVLSMFECSASHIKREHVRTHVTNLNLREICSSQRAVEVKHLQSIGTIT